MTAQPTPPPTPSPAIVRAAQLECQRRDAAGELPRILVIVRPTSDANGLTSIQYTGPRYVRDPDTVDHCIERLTEVPR